MEDMAEHAARATGAQGGAVSPPLPPSPALFARNSPGSPRSKMLTEVEFLAAEEAKNRLERMTKLELMVEKRKDSFSYLKKVHGGGVYWLNTVHLARQTDLGQYGSGLSRQRVLRLFYLGLSLARLLRISSAGQLVVSILQLMEEFDYHFGSGTTQSMMKGMMAKHVDQPFPCGDWGDPARLEEPLGTKLYKFNNEVVYEFLKVTPIPFGLDYFEVYFSLCDIMCLIYNKFMDEECYSNPHVYDALIKVDAKIKHHVLNVTAKELTEMSIGMVRSELKSLR